MKIKFIAIWRLITAREFFLMADNGVTASSREKHYCTTIRKLCESVVSLTDQPNTREG